MPIDAAVRAERTWLHIQRNQVSLVMTKPKVVSAAGVTTPAVVLAAQTVRIASDNRSTVVGGTAGLNPKRAVVVYGVTAHPTQAANDIQEGYTFQYDGDAYRVNDVIAVPGAIQALATTG